MTNALFLFPLITLIAKDFFFYFKKNTNKKIEINVHPPKPEPNIVLNVKNDTLKYMS